MIIGITALALALFFVALHGKITLRNMLTLASRFFGLAAASSEETAPTATTTPKEQAGPTVAVTEQEEKKPTSTAINQEEKPSVAAPSISVQPEDESTDEDDDEAPAFPSLNSAQRASGPAISTTLASSMSSPPPTFQLSAPSFSTSTSTSSASTTTSMPPPPIPIRRTPAQQARLPSPASSYGSASSGGSTPRGNGFVAPPTLQPQPQPQNSMPPPPRPLPPRGGLLPPSTGASGVAAGTGLSLPSKPKSSKPRKKVILTPGHSPLDWARVQSSNVDLRTGLPPNTTGLIKVTPSELKKHRRKDDAWTVIEDKVYSVSAYVDFHPGGEKELLRVAGRDGTKLYMKTHPWVNYENMLRGCLVGLYVPEPVGKEGRGGLEEMD